MKRFRYALDPLCVAACVFYALARWGLRPHIGHGFWHDQFTDLLLIPAALPMMLWVLRVLGLRAHDRRPTWSEIGFYWATWSLAAELVAPKIFAHAIGDWRDVLAYAAGAAVAGAWWSLGTGFDLLARHYPWMERVLAGPKLQRCRTTWVGELPRCQRVLIAGVGHGPFLHEFLPRHPEADVVCLDASAEMLRVAETNARKAGLDLRRVRFVHATLPEHDFAGDKFDVIVTNFFLDCFAPEKLDRVVAALAAAAQPDASWLLADFAVPPRGLARWRARAVHALMYVFFRIVTGLGAQKLTEPDALLHARGFSLARRATSDWGMLRADLWTRAS